MGCISVGDRADIGFLFLTPCSQPPPLNTKPEAIGLQRQTYTMSDDPHLFQPPSSYPEAPKDMYYQIPETKPEPKKLTQLFPWESRAPKPTRVFPDDGQCLVSAHGKYSMPFREEPAPSTGSYGAQAEEPAGTWENYPRSNAWDEIPEIQNYVQAIQQSRKARFQVVSGTHAGPKKDPSAQALSDNDTSVKLTDFPSEVERPSLPVTPRPIRRPSAWDRDGDRGAQSTAAPSELPAAEGVPNQEDWVGHTVDVFLHLARLTYLYWKFTESIGTSRRASASAVGSLGQS
jgi:glycogenin glucosyltransferase